MLPMLFLYHCHFYRFVVVVFLLLLWFLLFSSLMSLLLHILFYYYTYCDMDVIVIFIMGVKAVVAIIIITGIFKLLLLIMHIAL